MVPDVTLNGAPLMSALHSKVAELITGLVPAISAQNCAHLSEMPGTAGHDEVKSPRTN